MLDLRSLRDAQSSPADLRSSPAVARPPALLGCRIDAPARKLKADAVEVSTVISKRVLESVPLRLAQQERSLEVWYWAEDRLDQPNMAVRTIHKAH